MQRYHDTDNDPVPIHSPLHDIERSNLSRLTEEFLRRGGEIEEVGHKMSDKSVTFVINPERTPVYAHLFTPSATPAMPTAPVCLDAYAAMNEADRHAGLILADAVLGNSAKWIARKHHMSEKYVRQIARDYHITFHSQR